MNRFWMLLKREYWENRGGFFWTPLIVSVLLMVLMLTMAVVVGLGLAEVDGESATKIAQELENFANQSEPMKAKIISGMLIQPASLIGFVMYIVIFFYLLGSLFDDRKDRSILFWKSLPVSDVEVVLSKLVMGLLGAPAIYAVFIGAVQLFMLVLASIGAFFFTDIPVWSTLWAPADIHLVWLLSLVSGFYYAFWWLPIAGWLLLASSLARRAPFLYAVIPPVFIVISELLLHWFGIIDTKGLAFLGWLGRQVSGGADLETLKTAAMLPMDEMILAMLHPSNAASVSLWLGMAVGTCLIAGAVMVRRHYPEI
jgi:ABC-2 type transport system permease protein